MLISRVLILLILIKYLCEPLCAPKRIRLRRDFWAFVACNGLMQQILNYLKGTGLQLGLLINFGEKSLVYKRFANTVR